MTIGQTLSDTELTALQEARRAQFAHPRLLTTSEIESMMQDFKEAYAWMDEELRRNPKPLRPAPQKA